MIKTSLCHFSSNLLLKVADSMRTCAFFSVKTRDILTVLSVQVNLIMCPVSSLGWSTAWYRSAWSEVSPHQQQSRWGPFPQAKPSHQPHVSHSPPCLASCSDHSHNKRHNIEKTVGCSARGLRQKLQNFTSVFFYFQKTGCVQNCWKVTERMCRG